MMIFLTTLPAFSSFEFGAFPRWDVVYVYLAALSEFLFHEMRIQELSPWVLVKVYHPKYPLATDFMDLPVTVWRAISFCSFWIWFQGPSGAASHVYCRKSYPGTDLHPHSKCPHHLPLTAGWGGVVVCGLFFFMIGFWGFFGGEGSGLVGFCLAILLGRCSWKRWKRIDGWFYWEMGI